jgi:hypothetical protein
MDEPISNKGDQEVMKAEMMAQAKSALTDRIIAYENGELNQEETLELFSMLVKNGMAWTLQGHYGRTAMDFINAGFLDRKGNILRKYGEDEG